MRCAWCGAKYTGRDDASIDHLDGAPSNNDLTNLASSHIGCNSSRAHEWLAGDEWTPVAAQRAHMFGRFEWYLLQHGADLDAGIRRAQRQRAELLDLAAGRELARRWYPSYRDACNRNNAAYRQRQTPAGKADLRRAEMILYGGRSLAEVGT
jgi:hypothetical protein